MSGCRWSSKWRRTISNCAATSSRLQIAHDNLATAEATVLSSLIKLYKALGGAVALLAGLALFAGGGQGPASHYLSEEATLGNLLVTASAIVMLLLTQQLGVLVLDLENAVSSHFSEKPDHKDRPV